MHLLVDCAAFIQTYIKKLALEKLTSINLVANKKA
jgi:hypothetical protein